MTALRVLAPMAGRLLPLDQVPDPAFAAAMLGPGIAIDPESQQQCLTHAPIQGQVAALHPHAVIVASSSDPDQAILVHLGIDTNQVPGHFTAHVRQGETVSAGQPLIGWSPAAVQADGRSPLVPVIALAAQEKLLDLAAGRVQTGDQLFSWR
ncbi:MAG: PTS glucose transporter subunit IIA [Beutenbergiaceae bacterium]